MLFPQFLLIFFVIISSGTCDGNAKNCPFCIDDAFMACAYSCIRMHLIFFEGNKNRSIGWYYGCGTSVIGNIPPVRRLVPDSFYYSGNLKFVDVVDEGPIKTALEVQFFDTVGEIERTDEYYRRRNMEDEREKQLREKSLREEEAHKQKTEERENPKEVEKPEVPEKLEKPQEPQDPQEPQTPGEVEKQEQPEQPDQQEKDANSEKEEDGIKNSKWNENVEYLLDTIRELLFGVVGVIGALIFLRVLKYCFSTPKNDEPPTRVVYKRGNNENECYVMMGHQLSQDTDDSKLFDVEG